MFEFFSSIRMRSSIRAPSCCWGPGRRGCWAWEWPRCGSLGNRSEEFGRFLRVDGLSSVGLATANIARSGGPADVVASGAERRDAPSAAEYCRGGSGRLRQHGDHDASGRHSRLAQAENVLNSGLVKSLKHRFQVRLYRLSDHLARIDRLDQLTSAAQATHIGDSLKQVLADAASLPIGAVILASDGADNSGGVDLETISEIRRQRIPIIPLDSAGKRRPTTSRSPTCRFRSARCPTRGWPRW